MSEHTEDKTNNALVVLSNEYTSTSIGLTTTASHNIDVEDAPRIICNQLLVKPLKSTSLEKLDELSSLELEIAKMHHVEDESNLDDCALISDAIAQAEQHGDNEVENSKLGISRYNNLSNGSNVNTNDASNIFEDKLGDKLEAITSGETALEHEDLIAVLKGLDSTSTEDLNINSLVSADSVLEEGVTIEGEGEYQIMEVIDDDSNAAADIAAKIDINATADIAAKIDTNVAADIAAKVDTNAADQLARTTKKTFGSTTLTLQQERALALEQMEVLKKGRAKQQHRRKQDIKPIKQVDPSIELVSSLEAEWSDDDLLNVKSSPSEAKSKLPLLTATTTSINVKTTEDNKTSAPLVTSVVLSTQVQSTGASLTSTTTSPIITTVNTATVTANSSEDKMPSTTSSSSSVDRVADIKSEDVLSSQPGFRRTRIIKRKIIWDPDAPETTFSYAKLVKSNTTNVKGKNENIQTKTITKGSTTITPIKKETVSSTPSIIVSKKTPRPTTPKVSKIPLDVNDKKTSTKSSEIVTKTNIGKDDLKSSNKFEESRTKSAKYTSDSAEGKITSGSSPIKRRSQTPVANSSGGVGGVKKKKVTEVDRLMGDEGAVNMLNSLEKLEANLGGSETRPMMRSRAATICEKIPPRKESPSPVKTTSPNNAATPEPMNTTENPQTTTNKAKRTNKPRASSSWDYVYKKKEQDFDDSLIIRRRSNSSYSSTTSLNRLSLDGPPASIANSSSTAGSKSNDVKTLPASTTPTSSATTKTSPTPSNKSSGSSKGNSTHTSAGKTFEFAKPENKKTQRRTKSPAATLTNDMKNSAPGANKRNARSPATYTSDDSEEVQKTIIKSPPSSTSTKERKDLTPTPGTISDVVVKKSSKVAQIIFNTNKAKLSYTFTVQMLNKLVDILDKLASDPDCHVVVISTNDTHFCQGVDITDLTKTSPDKRKNYATHLATSVKNYLKTLATYPKPLVAGINGSIMNLGVMQLALFDVVIAGDKTTFETPYVKTAQVPEGYSIWNNMNKIRGSFKTKLFWLCERIQSTEAALAGLVNKLTSANKVNDEALNTAKKIASYSAESYRAMKKTIITSNLDVLENSLEEEFNSIIKQWTSSECLDNLKKYIDQGHY